MIVDMIRRIRAFVKRGGFGRREGAERDVALAF
jgi:hypothetical protein